MELQVCWWVWKCNCSQIIVVCIASCNISLCSFHFRCWVWKASSKGHVAASMDWSNFKCSCRCCSRQPISWGPICWCFKGVKTWIYIPLFCFALLNLIFYLSSKSKLVKCTPYFWFVVGFFVSSIPCKYRCFHNVKIIDVPSRTLTCHLTSNLYLQMGHYLVIVEEHYHYFCQISSVRELNAYFLHLILNHKWFKN